ncbi:copper amine oxidase N-terminal domain-containing protein [Bacillota bacterium LX-D]|nr:copper amine oxidase N-terminal domain-containing protein [Bacillota bacterium LX-D]
MNKYLKSICFGTIFLVGIFCDFFPQPRAFAQENTFLEQAVENPTEKNEEGKKIRLTMGSNIIVVDGTKYLLTTSPKLVGGRTFLPLRFVIGQVLAAEMTWDNTVQRIFINKDDTQIVLTIGENKAVVNGAETPLDAAPLLEKGTTLVPIRFLAEQFKIKVDYDSSTQTITLTLPQETPPKESMENHAPIAKFRFDKEIYTAGQPVGTFDLSTDKDGDKIVETLWQVNHDEKLVAKTLSSMFKTPRAGTYDISYKVKDINGQWSDWYTESITILPNEKPLITELTTDKAEYAQGEEIQFSYKYENEDWETIKTERWTYRPKGVKESTMTPVKPEAIYSQGEYIVTLQLQDQYGNYSDKKEVVVKVNNVFLKGEFEYKVTHGKVGDTIDNFSSFNYTALKEIFPKKTASEKGKLIMSDSPEMVSQKGILYQETVWGNGRVLIHHINKFTEEEAKAHNKRLVVTATNNTLVNIDLTIWNKTIKGPSDDVFYLGQQLLYQYFKGAPSEVITIKPGSTQIIYDNGTRKWLPEQTISGMFDFSAPLPVTFTVAVLDQEDTLETMATMDNLPKDNHPRGTFNILAEDYHVDLKNETEAVKLLLGKGMPEWLEGTDGITKETVYNKGNYGMVYHIKVTAKEDTAIIINPRGYSFRGAIRWEDDDTYYIPAAGNYTGSTNRSAFAGIIRAGETREFAYMLPNGSASPVLFGFIPKSHWSKF